MDLRDQSELFYVPIITSRLLKLLHQPCAERVLMTLANQYRDFVTPMLAEAFRGIIGVSRYTTIVVYDTTDSIR